VIITLPAAARIPAELHILQHSVQGNSFHNCN